MTIYKTTISVIIVNYNVKNFLEQALESVQRALEHINSEIIVVDNNSIDGSVNMLKSKFPDINVIESSKNLGFSGGNNLALKKAKGEFVILLNPDTVVQEDTFSVLLDFFDLNPDASAATCKILNPDGSFSVDCRHSIPTPSTALWKILGLNKMFPKNRVFGKYNLTFLDENETYQVEAISGSFMMIRKNVIDKVGLLDDTFFMYCEDIDYCYRINKVGGKIYYVNNTQIIHYKGESSKADSFDYILTFNRSLYQFYKKHYQQKYIYPFKWMILTGIILRGSIIFVKNYAKRFSSIILDLIIINLSLFFSFWLRYEMKQTFNLDNFFNQYIIINIIASLIYIISALFFELSKRDRFAPEKVFKVLFSTFLTVAAITFFFNQFAFSRFVVLIAAASSSLLMIAWRLILSSSSHKYSEVLGKNFVVKKALIVGNDAETKSLLAKLRQRLEASLDIVGLVASKKAEIGKKINGFEIVTTLDQLKEYVKIKKIDIILFSTHNIPYQKILSTMSRLQNEQIEFKMVPEHMEFMIGKSNIERLDNVSLIEIDYAYGKLFNRFIKRIFDITFSIWLLPLILPVLLFHLLFFRKNLTKREIMTGSRMHILYWYDKSKFLRLVFNLVDVFSGRVSFVGAPIKQTETRSSNFEYKPGLTGIVQINSLKIVNKDDVENFELHYLKNQSLFMDLEILFSAIFKK